MHSQHHPDRGHRWLLAAGLTNLFLASLLHLPAAADVIVLANRAGGTVQVRFEPVTGQAQQVALPLNDVVPLFVDGRAHVSFSSSGNTKRYLLDANSAYFFGRGSDGRMDLQKIGFGDSPSLGNGRPLPGSASRPTQATITVKILVDEEEPARQVIWERRLRRRVEAASEILEKYSRVGLRVVAVDTWNSDNDTHDFEAALAEFEREVKPAPAQVALGFTSQWTMVQGRTHMAGTRGPLYTHILAREGSPQISESEKLEFLVHELGHFLGATHSPEQGSVMRPVLGNNRTRRTDYSVRFDPVNTLVISLVGEEIRRRNIVRFSDMTTGTKLRLAPIYDQLAVAMPGDPSSSRYRVLLSSAVGTPLADSAKVVLQAIQRAAVANHALPMAAGASVGVPARRTGDELTDYYVRQAALAASRLPEDVAPRAFMVALGVGLGLDDSNLLAKVPGAAGLIRAVETPSDRAARLAVLGQPTMRGRRDLAQHFVVSGFLVATLGSDAAESAGIAKELMDAQGTSGLSFADIAADRAGIRFAEGVQERRFSLKLLSLGFSSAAFMPEVDGLPESLTAAQFVAQYGSADDPRFKKQLQAIDGRVLQLAPYRVTARPNRP